jgi:hypothetical protein
MPHRTCPRERAASSVAEPDPCARADGDPASSPMPSNAPKHQFVVHLMN